MIIEMNRKGAHITTWEIVQSWIGMIRWAKRNKHVVGQLNGELIVPPTCREEVEWDVDLDGLVFFSRRTAVQGYLHMLSRLDLNVAEYVLGINEQLEQHQGELLHVVRKVPIIKI